MKTGTFDQSARFHVPKNEGQNKKTKTTFQCQHPPKMVQNTFVLCVQHFWVGFKPIFKIWLFGAVLPSKNDQNDKGVDGGLKIICFQKFFFILFCITKLLYKTLGPEKVCLSPPPTGISRKLLARSLLPKQGWLSDE